MRAHRRKKLLNLPSHNRAFNCKNGKIYNKVAHLLIVTVIWFEIEYVFRAKLHEKEKKKTDKKIILKLVTDILIIDEYYETGTVTANDRSF